MKLPVHVFLLLILSSCAGNLKETEQVGVVTQETGEVNENDETAGEKQSTADKEISVYVLYTGTFSDSTASAHVSLSDSYPWEKFPDERKLPDIEALGIENASCFTPPKKYRHNFLSKVGILESDTLFAYDYTRNILYRFAVSSLPFVAELSVYTDEGSWPYSEDDYQLGFEIKRSALQKSWDNSELLVVISAENPFNIGGMAPARWKKTASKKETINITDPYEPKKTLRFTTGQKYLYESNGYSYAVQDLSGNDQKARQLVVTEISSGRIVCSRTFAEHESASLSELNGPLPGPDDKWGQWTGSLFKNKPPVLFGFESFTFGCPQITFLDPGIPDIQLKCDNRH